MAHTPQARKRIRQDEARNTANAARRARIRTFVKKVESLIEQGQKDQIQGAFQSAMRELHQGARLKVISAGMANRKISRLAARIRSSAS